MALSEGDRARLAALAEPVQVHRELSAEGRQALHTAIYEQYQAGATEREIAGATGVSKSHVHRVLVAEAEARQQPLQDAQAPLSTASRAGELPD